MQLACFLRLLVLCAVAVVPLMAQPLEILVITRYTGQLRDAAARFQQNYGGDLAHFEIHDESAPCALYPGKRLVYVHGRYWSPEMRACADLVKQLHAKGTLVGASNSTILENYWHVRQAASLEAANEYMRFGGDDNLTAFLAYLYREAGGHLTAEIPKPKAQLEVGIYHPDADAPFATLDAYQQWYQQQGLAPEGAPTAAITFFNSNYMHQDMAHIDALIRAIEARGLAVLPVFTWPLPKADHLLLRDGKPVAQVLLALNLLMPSPENNAWLERTGMHILNLMTTTESHATWDASESGLPVGRIPIQLGTAERTGASEPLLIATTEVTSDGVNRLMPVPDRIEAAAERARRWARLATAPNADKRVALIYFNNPPGKGTLGASYLNLMPSLSNILSRLQKEGYAVEGEVPDEDTLKKLMLLSGRNVGEYAQGELDSLVESGNVALMPLSDYQRLYQRLPEAFRQRVEASWGAPAEARIMTRMHQGELHFVIPGMRMGNLFLGPQPLRAAVDEASGTAHDRNTFPPHSYVACYLWYKYHFGADALVHLGRHGTLEWLPGKDVAQSGADPGEVLIGNLPHAYYYVVDGGGEYIQSKRRSGAVMISHLTPMLTAAGVPPDQARLKDATENYSRVAALNPGLAEQYIREIRAELRALNLASRLGVDLDSDPDAKVLEAAEQHLHDLETQSIPIGMHAIGSSVPTDALREALEQFLRSAGSGDQASAIAAHAKPWAQALLDGAEPQGPPELVEKYVPEARTWLHNLRESPSQELLSLVRVLNAKYLPTGISGDPLRTPASVPTGRNMHDTDPRTFPTRSAWAVGKRMAQKLIEEQQAKAGKFPEKISMVLWYGEATRHQGIAEAQALALLGVEPVWSGRGQVDDVRLLSAPQLGRPRVDVVLTISGLYRDGMPEKIQLLDKAVQLAAAAADDNPVKANSRQVTAALIAKGVAPEQAQAAGAARIFGPPPGAFGVGIAGMMESSEDNGDQAKVAERYLQNMNYAYSSKLAGAPVAGNLAAHLANNEVVIHSRSTNLYGVLDNDDTFQFMGGLNAATTLASGKAPRMLISNVRKGGDERFEAMEHFVDRELHTRTWNPKWIEGMKTAGYAGAREIAKEIEHLYGLRATAPEVVDPSAWQKTYEVFVADKYGLGMKEFFQKENPHAQQMVAARLLEIDRQGVHRFSDADRRLLLKAYIDSINRNGASCYVNACDNQRLTQYVQSQARELSAVSAAELSALRQQLQRSLEPRGQQPSAQEQPTNPAPLPDISMTPPNEPRPPTALLFDFVREFTADQIRERMRNPVSVWDFAFLGLCLLTGSAYGYVRRRRRPAPLLSLGSIDVVLPSVQVAAGD